MKELRRIRNERGLTQRELADLSGVDPATISLVENGKRRPHLETLDSLAGVLGVEVRDLFPKVEPRLPFEDDWQPQRPSAETIRNVREGIRAVGFEGFREAGMLMHAAEAVAEAVEHAVARESHGLEEMYDAQVLAVGFCGYFNVASKKWLEQVPPRMQERLRQLGDRLQATRASARTAFQARREEAERQMERDALNVVKLRDEEHRETRERFEDTGA